MIALSLAGVTAATAEPATGSFTESGAAVAAPSLDRYQGSDRFATAADIAGRAYPNGAGTVIIANGVQFPDALSAAPAAASIKAPLLLTAPTALPSTVADRLVALKPKKVVVVGGVNAVSPAVATQIGKITGATVKRVSGDDRYATSRAVVEEFFGETGVYRAFVTSGLNFPDAISASAAAGAGSTDTTGAPDAVVLVPGTAAGVDRATSTLLGSLGVESVAVVGGPAVISDGILSDLDAQFPDNVALLAGEDRYETSAFVSFFAFSDATGETPRADDSGTVYLASGQNFPDALAIAAVAGAEKSPVLLTSPGCTNYYAEDLIAGLVSEKVVTIGGPAAVSENAATLNYCAGPPRT
nr:cell wall-binding repeat-containing protein [Frigoribacterium sp. VKM Ac-2836]